MIKPAQHQRFSATANRLAALVGLGADDRARIARAEQDGLAIRAHRDIVREGQAIGNPTIMVEGWAFRSQLVPSGQRQILGFILPGEMMGICTRRNPVAVSTITTLTSVVVCPAPQPLADDAHSGLAQAYSIGAALEEAYLCRQITRLGRMNAYERVVDWLLELNDRLALAGIADANGFAFPLTQELIADALGLTTVHVNRMIRALRESGMVTIGARTVKIHDRRQMERLVCYTPVKVVA